VNILGTVSYNHHTELLVPL